MGMYWYVSRQKVDALLPQFGPRGFNLFKELSLTLKAPFVEAKTSVNPDRSVFLNVEKVENGMKSAGAASDLAEAGSKSFFSFRGRAYRAIETGAYFIVLRQGRVALILAGSPSNAVGAPPKQSDNISPSADPIGAVTRIFDHPSDAKDLSGACTHMWATMARPVRENWGALPEVEGIAVFGAALPADINQLWPANFADIDRVVVGTPIFVRQL
jgi:hypothetical protein